MSTTLSASSATSSSSEVDLERLQRKAMLLEEHRVLVQHLAHLQTRMSELVQRHRQQVRHWQDVLMRQTIRLLLERTRTDWHLLDAQPPLSDPPDADSPLTAEAAQATQAIICQTGCVMDELHWRNGERCRLTGQTCLLVAATSAADASDDGCTSKHISKHTES